METGKVNTILQQLSTEKHQWWGTQKVRGFLQRCKTSRLSRRRETVRPREVVPRPPSKLLSCLRLNADLLTVTITMSSCQWPLIVVADSGCVVVLCAVVLVSWPESGVRHCNIALDRSSHFRKRLPTSLVNFVRGANTAAIDGAKAGEEGRVRGSDLWSPWIRDQASTLHTPIHGETRLRWGSYWATFKYFKGHGTETLVLVFAITTFFSRSFYAVQFS